MSWFVRTLSIVGAIGIVTGCEGEQTATNSVDRAMVSATSDRTISVSIYPDEVDIATFGSPSGLQCKGFEKQTEIDSLLIQIDPPATVSIDCQSSAGPIVFSVPSDVAMFQADLMCASQLQPVAVTTILTCDLQRQSGATWPSGTGPRSPDSSIRF